MGFEDEVMATPPRTVGGPNRTKTGAVVRSPEWKFSDARARTILKVLEGNGTVQVAVDMAGISHKTFYNWMTAGNRALLQGYARCKREKGDEAKVLDYVDPGLRGLALFTVKVREAYAKAQFALVGHVAKAAKRQWQAAAWLLERRWPETYGKKPPVAADGTAGGGTTVSVYLPSNNREDTVTGVIVKQQAARPALTEPTLETGPVLIEGEVGTDGPDGP